MADLTAAQQELQAKHGTPEQFEASCWRAVGEFISVDEARAAIRKYQTEWRIAGLAPAAVTKLWSKLTTLEDDDV